MNIRIDTLLEMPSGYRACEDARDWFTCTFPDDIYPDGVDVRIAWDALKNYKVPERLDWLIWFGCHWLPIAGRQDLFLFAAHLAMQHGWTVLIDSSERSHITAFDLYQATNWAITAAIVNHTAGRKAMVALVERLESLIFWEIIEYD